MNGASGGNNIAWRVSLCPSSPSSPSTAFSEWEQPLTEQELQAIESVEAKFRSGGGSSSTAGKRRSSSTPDRNDVTETRRKHGRFLPKSILSLHLPHRSSSSPSQGNSKMKFPAMKFGGRIIYSRTKSEVERSASKLLESIEAIKKEIAGRVTLGFDIEWKPSFKRGVPPGKVAVMQLCLDTNQCHVMHIFHSGIPPALQFILEDSAVHKVGAGIANDCVKVFKDYNVSINPVEDLSPLANQKLVRDPQTCSLGSLTEKLISKQLLKPNRIRLGNWEVGVLSKEQLQYAATDAFASWYLYEVLKELPDTQKVE